MAENEEFEYLKQEFAKWIVEWSISQAPINSADHHMLFSCFMTGARIGVQRAAEKAISIIETAKDN